MKQLLVISCLFLVACAQTHVCDSLISGYFKNQNEPNYSLIQKNTTATGYSYNYMIIRDSRSVTTNLECKIDHKQYTLLQDQQVIATVFIPH